MRKFCLKWPSTNYPSCKYMLMVLYNYITRLLSHLWDYVLQVQLFHTGDLFTLVAHPYEQLIPNIAINSINTLILEVRTMYF